MHVGDEDTDVQTQAARDGMRTPKHGQRHTMWPSWRVCSTFLILGMGTVGLALEGSAMLTDPDPTYLDRQRSTTTAAPIQPASPPTLQRFGQLPLQSVHVCDLLACPRLPRYEEARRETVMV